MKNNKVPESTAERVALWRALHREVDAPPPVLEDSLGLMLADPPENWRERPDMQPDFTRPFRASIVARARFIDDLVLDSYRNGLRQYVLLGSGLDTFALRKKDLIAQLEIFEVDTPDQTRWKEGRLRELGMWTSSNLHLVPFDFETEDDWLPALKSAGFQPQLASIVTSLGVSMYLSKKAIQRTLEKLAAFAPGTRFIMSFLLPLEMADPEVRPGLEAAAKGAAASGTPFVSYFRPEELLELAKKSGFSQTEHVSADRLAELYFADRTDGLRPPSNAEELLIATV